RVIACFVSLSFAGLVVLARSLNPIPSRTRPLNSSAPMVLWLKPWESRSLPDLPRTKDFLFYVSRSNKTPPPPAHAMRPGEAAFLFWRCIFFFARLRARCRGATIGRKAAIQIAKHLSRFAEQAVH